jgi:hypothetical protein
MNKSFKVFNVIVPLVGVLSHFIYLYILSDSFLSECWVILDITDLALSCIQLVPTFVTGYISDVTFNQKRCAEMFPFC